MSTAAEHNRRAWDRLVTRDERHTRAARDAEFADPLAALDSRGWLGGDVRGKRVLCLASGGGRQSALFAAAGALVTVVDVSPAMLALDREVAVQRGLDVRCVQTSMEDLSMLEAGYFDIVSQPVSTCYVPNVAGVYQQVARVVRVGGLYVSQHKQPGSLQAHTQRSQNGYELIEPYDREGPLPEIEGSPHRESGTLEYLHTLEALIGALCRSGFAIEDFVEPPHGRKDAPRNSFAERSRYVAPYLRMKARRVDQRVIEQLGQNPPAGRLWTPS